MPTSTHGRTPTRWVGLTPDDRRAERRALLVDAAFDLLGTEGSAGTTVRAICKVARLNPRYFYESFEDLDELLVAVYDRVVEELGTEARAAIEAAGDDARAQVRAGLASIVDFVAADPRRGRVLYVEALDNERLNRRRIETGHALVGLVEQAGIQRHGPPRKGEHIGRIGAAIVVGGASELIVAWLEGRIDASKDQLIDDGTELLISIGERAATVAAGRARKR